MLTAEALWQAMNEGKARSKPPTILVTDHHDFTNWLTKQDQERVFRFVDCFNCALAHYAADRLNVDLTQQPFIRGDWDDDSFTYYGRDGVKIRFGWPLTDAVNNIWGSATPPVILDRLAKLVNPN